MSRSFRLRLAIRFTLSLALGLLGQSGFTYVAMRSTLDGRSTRVGSKSHRPRSTKRGRAPRMRTVPASASPWCAGSPIGTGAMLDVRNRPTGGKEFVVRFPRTGILPRP